VPGTYVLFLERATEGEIAVGALGSHTLAAGWYAYVGSAFGPGGFSRVERHRRSAAGGTDPHWHIDYLLADPDTRLDSVVAAETDAECAVSQALPDGPVPGFGASDCSCSTHLAFAPERGPLFDAATAALGASSREDRQRADGADE
jgi:endonuclease-3